jgi:hypothetical protein
MDAYIFNIYATCSWSKRVRDFKFLLVNCFEKENMGKLGLNLSWFVNCELFSQVDQWRTRQLIYKSTRFVRIKQPFILTLSHSLFFQLQMLFFLKKNVYLMLILSWCKSMHLYRTVTITCVIIKIEN